MVKYKCCAKVDTLFPSELISLNLLSILSRVRRLSFEKKKFTVKIILHRKITFPYYILWVYSNSVAFRVGRWVLRLLPNYCTIVHL
jgi:hypothetical protein